MAKREYPKGNGDYAFDVLRGLPELEKSAGCINDRDLTGEGREQALALREHLEAARVAAARLFNLVGDGTITVAEVPSPRSHR